MELQVTSFESTIALATIPANRQWVFSPSVPAPQLLLGTNKNVAIKKIDAAAYYPALPPTDDILITDFSIRFQFGNFNGEPLRPTQGRVNNPTAGVFQLLQATPAIAFDLTYEFPTLDFENDFIVAGGLLLLGSNTVVFSNTTTVLNPVFRIYTNIYWHEL